MNQEWLFSFLDACVRAFHDEDAAARLEIFQRQRAVLAPDDIIRRWVEYRLRQTGVVYGTPLASEDTIANHTSRGYAQREAVFLALLKIEADLAMEIGCAVSHCTLGLVRVAELLVCFALLRHRFKLATAIDRMIPTLSEQGSPPKRLLKLAGEVGKDLRRHAYLAGNPLLGLPIHNSFNYVDAKTLGRLAVSYYEHGLLRPSLIKVLDYRERERELLLRAMVGLTLADRELGVVSLQVLARQIKSLGLSRASKRGLLRLLKGKAEPLLVAAAVNDDRTRDFLLEQVILGAMLDGHVSEQESVYIGDLAAWLVVSAEELARLEAEVLEFYEQHKAYLDVFMVGSAVKLHRQRMIERLQGTIGENLGSIVREIRETKELAELLYRDSLGDELSKAERRKMAKQLVDILRAIPALAIFSLPGGALLLPLLFRVLPDGLKPKVFSKRSPAEGEDTRNQL